MAVWVTKLMQMDVISSFNSWNDWNQRWGSRRVIALANWNLPCRSSVTERWNLLIYLCVMIMSHHLQSMTQIKYMSRLHQLWRLANVHQAIVRNTCSQQLIITLINSCNTTLNWIRVSKSLYRFSTWNNHRSSAKIVTNTKNGVADNNCTDESTFPSSFFFFWLLLLISD